MGHSPTDMISDWLTESYGWRIYEIPHNTEVEDIGVYHWGGWPGDEQRNNPANFWGEEELIEEDDYETEYTNKYNDNDLATQIKEHHKEKDSNWNYYYVAPDGFFTDNWYMAAYYQDTVLGGM